MIFGMKLPNNQIQKSGAEVWSQFNKAWPASDLERWDDLGSGKEAQK